MRWLCGVLLLIACVGEANAGRCVDISRASAVVATRVVCADGPTVIAAVGLRGGANEPRLGTEATDQEDVDSGSKRHGHSSVQLRADGLSPRAARLPSATMA